MPIPEWVTKWIQQLDDEFVDVVCNEGLDTENVEWGNIEWSEHTDILGDSIIAGLCNMAIDDIEDNDTTTFVDVSSMQNMHVPTTSYGYTGTIDGVDIIYNEDFIDQNLDASED